MAAVRVVLTVLVEGAVYADLTEFIDLSDFAVYVDLAEVADFADPTEALELYLRGLKEESV